MRAWISGCAVALVMSACGSSTTSPACVPGSTQVCSCTADVMGVQSCLADRTFSTCDCSGVAPRADGGAALDGSAGDPCPSGLTRCGDRCVDTSTDEAHCGGCGPAAACASGSFCVSGACQDVARCPPPFVECGGACIDPSTTPEFCGASGACTGASAGRACGGACRSGRCVYESCDDVLEQGASTGDGLYLVDVDGPGPIPARDVHCDMTTEGGGWTLVYRVRNDVPDIADPWWSMIALGSGDALPATASPLPAGPHFDGPTREVRATFYGRLHTLAPPETRVTTLSSTGEVLVDAASMRAPAAVHLASGAPGLPAPGLSTDLIGSRVITAASGIPLAVGAPFRESLASDVVSITTGGELVGVFGDGGIATAQPRFANSTALFWVRRFRP